MWNQLLCNSNIWDRHTDSERLALEPTICHCCYIGCQQHWHNNGRTPINSCRPFLQLGCITLANYERKLYNQQKNYGAKQEMYETYTKWCAAYLIGFAWRWAQFVCWDSHRCQDLSHLLRVYATVVGHILLTSLMYIHITNCNKMA